MIKTLLIIDDLPRCVEEEAVEYYFAEVGITIIAQQAYYHIEAFKFLAELQARGLQLDILSCDIDSLRNNKGIKELEKLIANIERDVGSGMLPKKIFFHSASQENEVVITALGPITQFHSSEFRSLSYPQDYYDSSNHYRTNSFRAYLNEAWGTRFIYNESQNLLRRNPDGPLSPDDAATIEYEKQLPTNEIFRRLSLKEKRYFIDSMDVAESEPGEEKSLNLSFESGAFGSVSGKLAYSDADVAALHANHPDDKIILVLEHASSYETPPAHIAGLVVLEEKNAAHILQVCDNMAVPALVGAVRDTWNDWQLKDGHLIIKDPWEERSSQPLERGTGVTLVAQHDGGGRLHAAELPLVCYSGAAYKWRPFIRLAETAFKSNGLQIKAIIDTPQQVSDVVEFGGDGIGLARSEHMFLSAAGKAMIRECLLSGRPSAGLLTNLRLVQKADFETILSEAHKAEWDFPVTIRLLDAPPSEFMSEADAKAFSARVGAHNQRGVQAGLRTEGLYEAQIVALAEAFAAAGCGQDVTLLVPNVNDEAEMDAVRAIFHRHTAGSGIKLAPMVETCAYAKYLADAKTMPYAAISYGTRDLTSDLMGGISNDDSQAVLTWIRAQAGRGNDVGSPNPFRSLMTSAKEIMMSIQNRPDAPRGTICGMQMAGDEPSIRWAARNNFSMSMPARYIAYAKLVAGQELLFPRPTAASESRCAPD